MLFDHPGRSFAHQGNHPGRSAYPVSGFNEVEQVEIELDGIPCRQNQGTHLVQASPHRRVADCQRSAVHSGIARLALTASGTGRVDAHGLVGPGLKRPEGDRTRPLKLSAPQEERAGDEIPPAPGSQAQRKNTEPELPQDLLEDSDGFDIKAFLGK